MRLFAFNINAINSCNGCVTGKAYFVNLDCAGTGIFDFFYLISGRVFKPFIGHFIIEYNVPNAFFAFILFLFTGRSGGNYNSNGDDYFFHMAQNKNKVSN